MFRIKYSDNCLKLIKEFEGCNLEAYKCPAGVWTIGYGTTNADKSITGFNVSSGKRITKSQALDFLKKSLDKKYVPNVNKYHKIYKFNQNQYDALVSFAYNIGSIDQLVGNGKYSINTIANNIMNFNHCNGEVLKGLTRRRQAEHDLFVKNTSTKNTTITSNKSSVSSSASVTYKVYNCSYLNVRNGPGTSYKSIKTLKCGDEVCISDSKSGWGRISGTNNYVSMYYLQKVSKIKYKVYNCSYLNVRNGPGTSYKSIKTLKCGDEVCISDSKNGWGRISGSNNYVSVKYIKNV